MPTEIDSKTYFSHEEVAEKVGVSRQTLWRWRSEGKIPSGHQYRGRRVLFSEEEFELIEKFAHRLEPIATTSEQMNLFGTLQGTGS